MLVADALESIWCQDISNHCEDLGCSSHLRDAWYVWCVMCYMWHTSHSQSQNAGCWCPGIYMVPGHQQPLWRLRPASTSEGCMLCMMCDVLHMALKSQSKSECWLLMRWHLYMVTGHQHPSWWHRLLITSQKCTLFLLCDMLHVALKSQSKSEWWLLMAWHLYMVPGHQKPSFWQSVHLKSTFA